MNPDPKPFSALMLGQTPPPWHGQAVATKLLADHSWPDIELKFIRMGFSDEMENVGRFQLRKIEHLFSLIRQARSYLRKHPEAILFYPPASANWVPFLRDVIFLLCVRPLAAGTVFIFHASGLADFVQGGSIRRLLGRIAYQLPEVSLEVAQEEISPHQVFGAKDWQWCPCGIQVPEWKPKDPAETSVLKCLFVGSLQEGKGVLEILKTAKELKQRGLEDQFRFQIVGRWFSDEFREQATKLREALGVETMVELIGELTGEDKWQAYREADLFFFPTHYSSEASPIVLMEALGCGLPILSTQWAGIPAMLNDCPTATLLPIRSPKLYADALIKFSSENRKDNENASESRRFYEQHFLPERFIERVSSAIKKATKTNS